MSHPSLTSLKISIKLSSAIVLDEYHVHSLVSWMFHRIKVYESFENHNDDFALFTIGITQCLIIQHSIVRVGSWVFDPPIPSISTWVVNDMAHNWLQNKRGIPRSLHNIMALFAFFILWNSYNDNVSPSSCIWKLNCSNIRSKLIHFKHDVSLFMVYYFIFSKILSNICNATKMHPR